MVYRKNICNSRLFSLSHYLNVSFPLSFASWHLSILIFLPLFPTLCSSLFSFLCPFLVVFSVFINLFLCHFLSILPHLLDVVCLSFSYLWFLWPALLVPISIPFLCSAIFFFLVTSFLSFIIPSFLPSSPGFLVPLLFLCPTSLSSLSFCLFQRVPAYSFCLTFLPVWNFCRSHLFKLAFCILHIKINIKD